MEPQERDLITTLLTRLQDASKSGQRKEPEADAMVRQAMAQVPDAPYYLVQTVLIQDLSLQNAQVRIAELEKRVASRSAPQEQPTSFLGGLFGRSSPPAPAGVPPSGPWTRGPQAAPPPQQGYGPQQYAQQGYAQQPGPQQQPGSGMFGGGGGGGGSSFLRSAAATAAGVAGGALLFQGISSLFGHSYANSLGGGLGGTPGGLSETVTNNYYGDQGGGDYGGGGDISGGGDYAGDGGGDYGGGGDFGGGGDYGGDGDYGSGDDYGGGGDFGGGGDNFSC